MIDIKDLMIGDWVYLNREPKQIMQVLSRYADIDCRPYDYADLDPIPLTPEILEKNEYRWNDTISAYELREGPYYVSFVEHGRTRICVANDYILGIPIEFVHELQHVLRLCGIDKEIVL